MPASKRSDIWSFGCVLYEMLTGKIPFKGKTVSDTLASILEHEPETIIDHATFEKPHQYAIGCKVI